MVTNFLKPNDNLMFFLNALKMFIYPFQEVNIEVCIVLIVSGQLFIDTFIVKLEYKNMQWIGNAMNVHTFFVCF